jgi:hypothetical protein
MEGLAAAPGRAGTFNNLGLEARKTFHEDFRAKMLVVE